MSTHTPGYWSRNIRCTSLQFCIYATPSKSSDTKVCLKRSRHRNVTCHLPSKVFVWDLVFQRHSFPSISENKRRLYRYTVKNVRQEMWAVNQLRRGERDRCSEGGDKWIWLFEGVPLFSFRNPVMIGRAERFFIPSLGPVLVIHGCDQLSQRFSLNLAFFFSLSLSLPFLLSFSVCRKK